VSRVRAVTTNVDGEEMEENNSPAVEARRETSRSDRALRHELHIPLRYRLEGREEWLSGEAINMSESGLLFSSDDLLEVNSRVQITFQNPETPMVKSGTRQARVVRRILSNWPETRVLFGAKFC
jgi:PilZ domain